MSFYLYVLKVQKCHLFHWNRRKNVEDAETLDQCVRVS